MADGFTAMSQIYGKELLISMQETKNILTVDLEDWYHANTLGLPWGEFGKYAVHVVKTTELLLDLLRQFQVKATFFVVGDVAERHPRLLQKIVADGHEVGSHSHHHQLLTGMDREQFARDFREMQRILADCVGHPVRYFRAPSWSINRSNLWVLEYLADQGVQCDASLQPFVTPLSGMRDIPHHPFYPVVGGRCLPLLEFPATVLTVGKWAVPFSGGFYLRFWPYSVVKTAMRRINRKQNGVVYVHPWEFDPEIPRMRQSPPATFVNYYNLGGTLTKLTRLLQDFSFGSIGEVIAGRQYESFSLNSGGRLGKI